MNKFQLDKKLIHTEVRDFVKITLDHTINPNASRCMLYRANLKNSQVEKAKKP